MKQTQAASKGDSKGDLRTRADLAVAQIKKQFGDGSIMRLGEALLIDVFAAWHATRRLDVFLAVENLLDKTYDVGRAGLATIGQPRFVHGGLRIQGGG